MATTAGMLADVPIFSLMDDDERALLAERMEVREFRKGETLFNAGDAGDSLMIVKHGRVQVFLENTEGQKIILSEIEPGELIGEISLFDPGARTATAVAVEDSELLVLDHEDLWEVMQRKPHIAKDMLAVLGKRLRATDELLRQQVSRNVNEEEEDRLTLGQRVADRVAVFGGSWTFIIIFACLMASWMAINVILTVQKRAWDEYPFILLNLALSTLAALQAPIIMMSQNRQSYKDRLKADLDYQVNLKAELEVAQLHNKVDKIYEAMQAQFSKMEKEKKAADRSTTTSG